MKRFTEKNKEGYCISDENLKDAVQRLGEFEDAYEALKYRQELIPKELESLRLQGKEKTVKFREAMAQKLINNNIILFFESHGLK